MHIVLTGGGTAGHVMPNKALIEELKATWPDLKITYIGSKKGMEAELLKDEPVDFKAVSVGKLRRYLSLENFTDLFRVPKGVVQTYFILGKAKPDLVFSKGGYVGLPVVLGAWFRRIPVIIHESDSVPGLTTKITKRFATEKWSSYDIKGFKQVDLPIRSFLKKGNPGKYKSEKPTLLVMGGSQGAQAINVFIKEAIEKLTELYQVIHITGKGKSTGIKHKDYVSYEYVDKELADIYAAADFVLCRAGASSLAELKALKKKAILIPLATDKSRGEQLTNAKLFAEQNPALVIPEENLSMFQFNEAIKKLEDKSYPPASKDSNVTELFSRYWS